MRGLWGVVVIAAISYVTLLADHAYAETWSCAIADKGWTHVQQYRLEGNVLKDLTGDKTWREILQETDKAKFLGQVYNVLLDNNYAIVAELDSAVINNKKTREIYVVNIIIDKETSNLIKTTIISHLPEPNKIDTEYGSCTVD